MSEFDVQPTNTLSGSAFDVLKTDYKESPEIDINRIVMSDLEESYFELAIDYIKESSASYTNSKIALYRSLSEATNDAVIMESFSDFFSSVKDIIEKFLKFLKSLFQRFITFLNSFISSDNYLRKHKKDFDDFRPGDNFYMNGFNFTFAHNIPRPEAILDYSADLVKEITPGLAAGNVISIDDIKAAVDNMNFEDAYDEFRASVIGADGAINVSDFSEELFKIYRDGELDADELEVDSSYLRTALNRYFDYKKTNSDVEKQRKNVERAYRQVEDQVKKLTGSGRLNMQAFRDMLPTGVQPNYSDNLENDGYMSAAFMNQLNIFVKAKVDMIEEYSNIHAIAFAAKLDALKECYKQDRATLYTALSRIQRTDKKREV